MKDESTYEDLARRIQELTDSRQALLESERKWRSLVDAAPTYITVMDRDFKILFINQTPTGMSKDEIIGASAFDQTHPDFHAIARETIEGVFQTGNPGLYLAKAPGPDGAISWYENHVGSLTWDGSTPAVTIISTDITKRIEDEERLHLFQDLVDRSNDSFMVLTTDAGRFVFANDETCRMLGFSKQELLTIGIYDIDPQMQNPEFAQRDFSALEGKESVIFETRAMRKNGVEISVEVNAKRVAIEGSSYIVCIARDITARKEAEAKLRESEQRYKILVEMNPDAIILLDLSGRCLALNQQAAQMAGYSDPNEIIGMSFLEFIPPEQHGHFKSRMKKIVETGYLEPTEYTVNRKDGTSFVSESRTSLIRDPDGSPKAILSIGRDITERKRIEEEKRQLEAQYRHAKKMEAIGNLAGGIAHEFNNLLSVIMGNASVMLFGKDPNHEDYEALEDIEEAAKAASSLTSQLLGFARKEGYEVRTINLNHLVRDTFETFAKTKRQIRIHQDFAEDLAAIEADQSQLSQVLLNLFVHAADAMPDGGDLFLKTMNTTHDALAGIVLEPKPGIYVQFSITDSGAGMDRETREHIFEPFYSNNKRGSGSGLGLASVYGTVRSHGGHIAVESEQGQGTTFVIYLPASSKQIEDPVIQSKRATLSTRTILIVDDEKKVLDMAHKVIRKLGYEVLEASGGREAIEVFRSHHEEIDLVILDIIMPDMGGGEVFDSLNEIDPAVHVLLASGYSVDNTAREIMARGCDGFIQKPFNMKDLHQAIETIQT